MRAILLVDHGSRLAAANAQLAETARLVERRVPGFVVAHAHMELGVPSIADAVAGLARRGVTDLVVVPYFLASGRHAGEDVPRLARAAAERHGIAVRIAEPLGVHELLAELVVIRATE